VCYSDLREIGRFAFAATALTQINLPSSVCFLSGLAFCGLSLNDISFSGISDHVGIVGLFVRDHSGESLIRYFGDEEHVVIESSVIVIYEGCFSGCVFVKSVAFDCDSKLSRIEKSAFLESALISIHLPSSVEVLCEACFCSCESLTSITFDPGARLREISRFAFDSIALTQISLPSGVCFISGLAFSGLSLNDISFSGISDHFTIVGLFVRDHSGESLIRYFGDEKRVVIESSVVIICEGCFSECVLVQSVIFDYDSKLSRIEEFAFAWSGLISIHLPSSVEVLCEYCFCFCKSLTSVTFDCDSTLSRIEERTFAWSSLVSIHLPSSVEVLCEYCFSFCKSLTSVTFDCDSKLSRIEKSAFLESSLISIHLPSSVEVLCTECLSVCTRVP
jgi:hypothetical protein